MRARAAKPKEIELGPPVVAWLESRGWDVYQEVEGRAGRADIVATLGRLVAVVEMKTSLSLDVLEQGSRWIGHAHIVWVAVPWTRRSDAHRFACQVAEWRGFGVLHVGRFGGDGDVSEAQVAPLHRSVRGDSLRAKLRPEHKLMAKAGTATGGHWTPFKQTCRDLRARVDANPGLSIKEALDGMKTHYTSVASARASLTAMIEKGVVEGVTMRREGRQCLLYPAVRP